MALASERFVRRIMVSPDPEGALEHQPPPQPGARTDELGERDDDGVGQVPDELCQPGPRRTEGLPHPFWIARQLACEKCLGGQGGAPYGRADAFTGEVAGQASRVADQEEALAA